MLELRSIHQRWQEPGQPKRTLLDGVNLSVQPGQTVAVLGPSGCGKSTLLRIVAGLQRPDAGQVLLDGADLAGVPPERRQCALLFQDFALFPHLDVQDNVAFGLVEQGLRRAAARAQAVDLLQRFGLGTQARARVQQLSGGEQQRVALARALITRPRVLLLDEPFSALDAELRLQLRDEFRQRIAGQRMATLWVTHDETEARAMAGQGWRVVQGELVQAW